MRHDTISVVVDTPSAPVVDTIGFENPSDASDNAYSGNTLGTAQKHVESSTNHQVFSSSTVKPPPATNTGTVPDDPNTVEPFSASVAAAIYSNSVPRFSPVVDACVSNAIPITGLPNNGTVQPSISATILADFPDSNMKSSFQVDKEASPITARLSASVRDAIAFDTPLSSGPHVKNECEFPSTVDTGPVLAPSTTLKSSNNFADNKNTFKESPEPGPALVTTILNGNYEMSACDYVNGTTPTALPSLLLTKYPT